MTVRLIFPNELADLFRLELNEDRFCAKEFKYFDLKYIQNEVIYVSLSEDGKEVQGLAGFQKSSASDEPHVYWFNYVTVASPFRGKNIAKMLITSVLKDLNSRDPEATLKVSYTETGEVLRSTMEQAAANCGVSLWHKRLDEMEYKKAKSE